MSLQDDVNSLVAMARLTGTDSAHVEIKKAEGGIPKSLPETVSAFANGSGGMIILGLDENDHFSPVSVHAKSLANSLASACADSVEPAVRANIEIVSVDGTPIVAAAIPPTDRQIRPCYVKTQGIERGSYIREHDGDRHLSSYEIHLLVSDRGQPQDDCAPVRDASVADLDPNDVERLVDRFRHRRGPAFARFSTSEILRMIGVCPRTGENQITLAGLLSLGTYPQEFFPQLNVTFVSYPTVDGRPMRDGTRFLDNVPIDGSIPQMVSGLLDVVRRSMTRRSVIIGAGREDIWEYPIEAVRELIVNALMHRDYHPLSHGTQVRVEMYPDRLVFINPGGVYGAASTDELLQGTISTSRNAVLAKLLEDVEIPGTNRTVCENRGSGLRSIVAELSQYDMQPLELRTSGGMFIAELRNTVQAVQQNTVVIPEVPSATVHTVDNPEAIILDTLAKGPQSTAQLMDITGLTKPAIGRRIRSLEAQGLITPTAPRRSRGVKWELIR